jgi:uridine phosphorylase
MTFPIYAGKHTQLSTPLVTPERFVQHLRDRGLLEGYVAPEGIVLLYHPAFARELLEREPHRSVAPYPGRLHLLDRLDGRVGVMAFFGIGAPAAAALVETLEALGTRMFLNLGAAGGLQPGARVGELVVCSNAVRDEGLSHHYLAPARYASPSARLTDALILQLKAAERTFTVGSTWTIDAPFRETVEELRHYCDEGVLTVEMEAAAVFAVAEHRGFEAAAAFVLSDVLSDADWTPDFGSLEIQRGLTVLVDAAIEVIEAEPRGNRP